MPSRSTDSFLRAAAPRRRRIVTGLECLEDRAVPASAANLALLEGPAFSVVGGAIASGQRTSLAAVPIEPGTITPAGGRVSLLRVIAVSSTDEALPVSVVTRRGGALPQVSAGDGSVFANTAGRRLFVRVKGAPGTSFQVFVSLAGDINGDNKVDATDISLIKGGFEGIGQVPQGSTPAQTRHIQKNVKLLLKETQSDRGESVTAATLNLALGSRLVFTPGTTAGTTAQDTTIGNTSGHWQLYVGGKPFYIHGVTGDYGYADPQEWTYDYLNADIANSGANTLRTYGLGEINQEVSNTAAALAWAARLSTPTKPMMILVGLYVPGVSADQLESAVSQIVKDPNASHIVGWCVGNEVDASLYPEIETVAKFIHTKSTAPVMTAVPNATTDSLKQLNATIPDLDWLGINTFYGQFDASHSQDLFLAKLDATMANGTWTKPWAVTEYYTYDLPSPPFNGYPGMPFQTLNGTPYYLELNSTANAANYAASWTNYIQSQSTGNNVGGFALNWIPPHNSQVPAFWKDMFVYRGAWQIYVNPYGSGTDRLGAVDAVTQVYGGTAPASGTPQIIVTDGDPQGIVAPFKATLTSAGTKVTAGQSLTASVTATDAQALTFDWYLIGGTGVTTPSSPGITGGPSTDPFVVYGSNAVTSVLVGHGTTTPSKTVKTQQENSITFTMPAVPAGNVYQLRVIIRDGLGGASTAAIGFAT